MPSTSILGDLFYSGPDREILIAPQLDSRNETTRRGVHVIGELSGIPLLKNSLNVGAETVAALEAELKQQNLPAGATQLVIVGAGAAGLAAAMEAKARGLTYVLLEQSRMAETIQKFHKHKPIFAEPSTVENQSRLWFEECQKEELLAKWQKQVAEAAVEIRAPVVMQDIREEGDLRVVVTDHGEFKCLRVLLAIGNSGNPRRLGIPGEDLPHVHTSLGDPDEFRGRKIAIVGAGDAGVEFARALCERNEVTILVRGNRIDRPKKQNRDAIHAVIETGKVKVLYQTSPTEILPAKLVLETKGEKRELATDEVFLALGAELPVGLLRKLGIRLESDWSRRRAVMFVLFMAFVTLLYLWKGRFFEGKLGIPEGLTRPAAEGGFSLYFLFSWLDGLPVWMSHEPSMIFGALYSVLVLFFGLQCIRKYRADSYQVKRYATLIFAQVVLLWIVPEILFQGLLSLGEGWRSYGLFMPAPLYVWNFWNPPLNNANVFWLIWALLLTFVGVPLIARLTGKKYCSWFCPCGALADTFGDRWRQLAPRGRRWRAWEMLGEWVVFGMVGVFVGIGVFSASSGAWTGQKVIVDFLLASVLGIGLYPFFGPRIWCRFLCPLSRCLHAIAGNVSQQKVSAGAHCIECRLCTKYCQMGIPVMEFARNAEDITNTNSSCIQCGICVTVCPVRNLQNEEWNEDVWQKDASQGALTRMA